MAEVLVYITAALMAPWVATATVSAGAGDAVAVVVYRVAAGLSAAVAVLTALTGARTPAVWFKVRPVALGTAILLLLVGSAV